MTTPASFREDECLNVYWKIKNFSYCCDTITSAEFSISGRQYYLQLQPSSVEVKCRIVCFDYCNSIANTMQISFLTCDGSQEESVSGNYNDSLRVSNDVLFGNRRNAFLPGDTLTVRFRYLTDSKRGKLFIYSQIGVKRKYFLWTLENLSKGTYHPTKYIEKSELYGNIELNFNNVGGNSDDEQFNIEISRRGGEKCQCTFKVSVLDVNGKAVNEITDGFVFEKKNDQQTRGFPSIIKSSKWFGYNKIQLLSKDTLSLKCYFAISIGTVTDQTAVIGHCDNATPLLKEFDELSMTFEEKNYPGSVNELQTDLKSILDDGTFFDASLQIDTEVIEVHRNILSARSPVFRAMFMKEKSNNTFFIEDLDVDTLRRLLLYMYTNTLHDNQRENMKKLYFAADKYEVLSLKSKCLSYLKTNLSIFDVCETLIFADLHQNVELKTVALDFISEYDSAVFASEEWKEFEKNHSYLALQIMREIHCNK